MNQQRYKRLGRAFKTLRILRGMTQLEVANHLGISESYVGKIEQGLRDPSWSVVLGMADALGTNVALAVAISEKEDERVAPIMPMVYDQVWRKDATLRDSSFKKEMA